MLHNPKSNERASSTKACFAMNSKSTLLSLSVVQKLINNAVWRRRSVQEVKVKVLDSILGELLLVILWLV